jgi:hypothetical protein
MIVSFFFTPEGAMVALSIATNVTCKHTAFVGVDRRTGKTVSQYHVPRQDLKFGLAVRRQGGQGGRGGKTCVLTSLTHEAVYTHCVNIYLS